MSTVLEDLGWSLEAVKIQANSDAITEPYEGDWYGEEVRLIEKTHKPLLHLPQRKDIDLVFLVSRSSWRLRCRLLQSFHFVRSFRVDCSVFRTTSGAMPGLASS